MDALGLAKDPSKINPMRAPRIGGLPTDYIQNQLTLIQKGKKRSTRPLMNTSTMRTKIKSLTPEDISDVAHYVHQIAPAYTSLLNK